MSLVDMRDYTRAQARIDELEAENAWLRSLVVVDPADQQVDTLRVRLRLRRQPAILLALLLRPGAGFVKNEALLQALGTEAENVNRILWIAILRMRRALDAAGAPEGAVVNYWGRGYGLSDEARQWLRQSVLGRAYDDHGIAAPDRGTGSAGPRGSL